MQRGEGLDLKLVQKKKSAKEDPKPPAELGPKATDGAKDAPKPADAAKEAPKAPETDVKK